MKTMTCIEDLRQAYHRKVPRAFVDYCESGLLCRADAARQSRRSRTHQAASAHPARCRAAAAPRPRSSASRPRCRWRWRRSGCAGMQHGDGEILACRAAQAAGIPFTLSTMSICSIEDVAGAVDKPFWFQLYVMKDRGYIRALIERAAAAKCSALVLTVDLQVIGQRHRDIKNGMSVPPQIRIGNLIDIATKPAWALEHARGKRKTFGNIAGHYPGMSNVTVLSKWIAEQFDADAELEGRRVDQEPVARQADPQGHSRSSRMPASPPRPARRRSSCPITAAASSTARHPRSPCCRRSPMRSAPRSR